MLSLLIFSILTSMFVLTGLTAKRAVKESTYAFSLSVVNRSEDEFLAQRILELMKARDLQTLYRVFVDRGVIDDQRPLSFQVLWESEREVSKRHRETYNRLLPYVPEDLREFFESLKILKDIDNFAVLGRYVGEGGPEEELDKLLSHGGIMEIPLLMDIVKSDDLEGFIDEFTGHLPPDFHFDLSEKTDFLTTVMRLNLAAVTYLLLKVEQIKSPEVYEAFSHLTFTIDAKNISTVARLKSEGASSEDILKWLIPYGNTIDMPGLTQLAEARDYREFLRLLLDTQFGKRVLRDVEDALDPKEIWETSLRYAYSRLKTDSEAGDAIRVWRYFFLLEQEERTIREGLRAIRPLARGKT